MLNINGMKKRLSVFVPAYLNYFQYRTKQEAGFIAGYHMLRNIKNTEAAVFTYGLEKKMEKTQET